MSARDAPADERAAREELTHVLDELGLPADVRPSFEAYTDMRAFSTFVDAWPEFKELFAEGRLELGSWESMTTFVRNYNTLNEAERTEVRRAIAERLGFATQ